MDLFSVFVAIGVVALLSLAGVNCFLQLRWLRERREQEQDFEASRDRVERTIRNGARFTDHRRR